VSRLPRRSRAAHERTLLAHWYAQTYKADQFVDLKDFCDKLREQFSGTPEVRRACTAVIRALSRCVIVSRCSGFATQHSYGVSIYFPWGVIAPEYWDRPFAEDTGWLNYLRSHLDKTRRDPRYTQRSALQISVLALLHHAGLNQQRAKTASRALVAEASK
jgi:hypothetical protein